MDTNNLSNEAMEDSDFIREEGMFYLAYKPHQFSVAWDLDYPILARVGFMHNDLNHGFVKNIKSTARNKGIRLLHLTTGETEDANEKDSINLLEFELTATEDGLTELENYRMSWVQLYLKMISYLNGRVRSEFIPQMKYYRNQEGPLAGYLRGVEEMGDSEEKNLIMSHIQKLISVEWEIKYKDERITDFIYKIEGSTFNEKLESLFIGAWSVMNIHYAREFNTSNIETLLSILQLGSDFIDMSISVEAREIIDELMGLLVQLTFPSVDELILPQRHALFIQSPMLFPMVNARVSHMFYGLEKAPDFDLRNMISDLVSFEKNEAIYRSLVVSQNNEEFIKKVNLVVED